MKKTIKTHTHTHTHTQHFQLSNLFQIIGLHFKLSNNTVTNTFKARTKANFALWKTVTAWKPLFIYLQYFYLLLVIVSRVYKEPHAQGRGESLTIEDRSVLLCRVVRKLITESGYCSRWIKVAYEGTGHHLCQLQCRGVMFVVQCYPFPPRNNSLCSRCRLNEYDNISGCFFKVLSRFNFDCRG